MDRPLKDVERFIAFVRPQPNGCWLWEGKQDRKGYAAFWFDGKTGRAARFAYGAFRRPLTADEEPDHLCRVTSCVNPDHLEAVDRRTNLLRGTSPIAVNAKKTHCKHGHVFDEKNTGVVNRNGYKHRVCRACARVRASAAYRRVV